DMVFLIATPIAAVGFLVVLRLKEYPLRSWGQEGAGPVAERPSASHAQHPQGAADSESTPRFVQQT
ncbi:MAG: hypothetical protein JWO42_4225, partial [Chloroflexi bacterium]|nr:hypothetical protein [Chloroflexota bacterium]